MLSEREDFLESRSTLSGSWSLSQKATCTNTEYFSNDFSTKSKWCKVALTFEWVKKKKGYNDTNTLVDIERDVYNLVCEISALAQP